MYKALKVGDIGDKRIHTIMNTCIKHDQGYMLIIDKRKHMGDIISRKIRKIYLSKGWY